MNVSAADGYEVDEQAAPERVARAFNKYLKRVGLPTVRIEAEGVVLGSRAAWDEVGLWISYRVDPDDAGLPSLEVYVHSPWMDDWHARIWADGFLEQLPAMRLWFGFDHTLEGADVTARQELLERNRTILQELRKRALCPRDHVHGFRRSPNLDPPIEAGELRSFPIVLASTDWKLQP